MERSKQAIWTSLLASLPIALLTITSPLDAFAYGSTQWEWRTSAIPNQVFPTQAAALAATKALGGGYALLDKEEGIDDVTTAYTYYKYSVTPRSPVIKSDWVYITGAYQHASEAEAIAWVVAHEIESGYSASQCQPPHLDPRGPWFTITNYYGISKKEERDYDDVRYGYSTQQGCFELYHPPLTYVMYRDRNVGCDTSFQINQSGQCVNFTTARIYKRPLISCAGACTNNPVDLATGSKALAETDYAGPLLTFSRYYQSLEPQSLASLGTGWSHSFSGRLVVTSSPKGLVRPSGVQEPLVARNVQVNGVWQTHWVSNTESGTRVEQQGTQYLAFLKDGSREVYSSTGRLLKLISPRGLGIPKLFRTPRIGAMMHPEVRDGEASLQPRVQA